MVTAASADHRERHGRRTQAVLSGRSLVVLVGQQLVETASSIAGDLIIVPPHTRA
eukprot:IDg7498t1